MMRRTAADHHAAPASALTRLLEVETRLEGMLEAARLEAEKTVGDARARAAARTATLAAELAAAEAEVSATLDAESAARVLREQDLLSQVRSRYEAVDARAVEALAAWVFEQVLGSVGTEAA
jgi:hypothetical protein